MKIPTYNKVYHKNYGIYTVPPMISQAMFDSAINYLPRENDLMVLSYPKNGTTWMLYILYLLRGGNKTFSGDDTFSSHYIPLEFRDSGFLTDESRPNLLHSHLKYSFAPINDKNKFIYIARNPKDTVVSFFYHTIGFANWYNFADGTFDDYFDLFINGECDFGNYFEVVPEWWEECKKRSNIHFVLYEDLKSDFHSELCKIANFLGDNYLLSLQKDDQKLLKEITNLASIENMKINFEKFTPKGSDRPKDIPFTRKGVIGDWKSLLSEEQAKQIDELLMESGKTYPGFDKLWMKYKDIL